MKGIWIIVSTLALANLLAILGLVAWLNATDRLDGSRIERVRALFAETVASEKARFEADEAARTLAELAAAEAEKKATAPLTSGESLSSLRDREEHNRQQVERLRREVEDLQRTLERERAAIDDDWRKLRAEREAFEAMRARIAAIEGGEQFERALRLYESLKPEQSVAMLQKLIDDGDTEQVVAYLNAMQTRTAAKILAEFPDPALAADLLERLRTRGLEARASEGP